MQKRKEHNGRKKSKIHSQTLPYTPEPSQTRSNQTQTVQTRPAMSEFVRLSYNPCKHSTGLAKPGEALSTAHHAILMNSSLDNPKTLVNARKLSCNTQSRMIVPQHQDESDAGKPARKLTISRKFSPKKKRMLCPIRRGRHSYAIVATEFRRSGPGPGKPLLSPKKNLKVNEGRCRSVIWRKPNRPG